MLTTQQLMKFDKIIRPMYFMYFSQTSFLQCQSKICTKMTRKPLAYQESNNSHLRVTRAPEICVNLVFKHIPAAAVTQSVDNLFHSFIALCENEHFLFIQFTLILY